MGRILVVAYLGTILTAEPLRAEAPKDPAEAAKYAKDKKISVENLKAIGLAFHYYSQKYGDFLPRDITTRKGKPLLSWRVSILPFLGEEKLYREFKLDEPWDSESNSKLLEKMPKVFTSPRGKFEKGHTYYQCFSGDGALMNIAPLKINQIPDGSSNTFLAVEAAAPVPWTKPADIEFDAKKPFPKLGGIFDGDFHAGVCDGFVYFIRKGADEKQLKRLVLIADGEPIGDDSFLEKP